MTLRKLKKYPNNNKHSVRLASFMALSLFASCSHVGRSPGPAEATVVENSSALSESEKHFIVKELPNTSDAEREAAHRFSLAQSYSLEGNSDRAIEEYKLALVYDPQSAVIHTRLATEYVKKGLLTFAIEECKQAIKIDERYTDARLLLAGLYGATKLVDEALKEYDSILKYESKKEDVLKEVYVFKASLLIEEKRVDDAVAALRKLIQMDPDSFVGYFYLGKAYMALGQLDKAEVQIKKALEIKPSFSQAALALGQIYTDQKKSDQALKVYERYFDETRDVQMAVKLAQAYLEKNDYKKSLKYLNVIQQQDPDNINVRVRIGLIYSELKNYEKAAEAFEGVLQKYPDAEKVRFYLGSVYTELKNYDKAIETFSKVSEDSTQFGEAALHMGYLYRLKGDSVIALEWLEKAVQRYPNESQFLTLKASLIEETKGVSEAIAALEEAQDQFSKDEKLLYYLGTLYDKTGDLDKALGVMKKILEVNPDSVSALNYVGYTLAVKGENLESAEQMVRQALALKPKDGYVQDSLGFVLLKRGRTKEALVELEKAYNLKPEEPIIIEHLGDIYAVMNLHTKALQKYIEASKLYTDENEKSKVEKKINDIRNNRAVGSQSQKNSRTPAATTAETP